MASKTEKAEKDPAVRPVMKVRRRAPPADVHRIFDSISYMTSDVIRQQATQERIQMYMRTRFGTSEGLIPHCMLFSALLKIKF